MHVASPAITLQTIINQGKHYTKIELRTDIERDSKEEKANRIRKKLRPREIQCQSSIQRDRLP